MSSKRHHRLSHLANQLQQRWGKALLQPLREVKTADALPTGYPTLDKLLGGGFAQGQLNLLHGMPSSGLTTLVYHTILQLQQQGQAALYIDYNHHFDAEYAWWLGIRPEYLLLAHPPRLPDGLKVAHDAIRHGDLKLIILDTGLQPIQLDGERLDPFLATLRTARTTFLWVSLFHYAPALLKAAALQLAFERQAWAFAEDRLQGYQTRVTLSGRHFPTPRALDLTIRAEGV